MDSSKLPYAQITRLDTTISSRSYTHAARSYPNMARNKRMGLVSRIAQCSVPLPPASPKNRSKRTMEDPELRSDSASRTVVMYEGILRIRMSGSTATGLVLARIDPSSRHVAQFLCTHRRGRNRVKRRWVSGGPALMPVETHATLGACQTQKAL